MKRILIVDDSATNLQFIESILKDKYKLALAKSGERAIRYLENIKVDLILLDLMMPEMDGFETFEHIREIDLNADTPIVFLTADVDVGNEIKGLNMGAMDFIRKPFVPEVVINRINNILQLDELMNDLEMKVEEKTAQIEQMSFATIATIASMIEAKDSYTKGHSVRVSEYSARLARKMGWSDERIQNLKYIALLHDIGKVGIPDRVLNKPGRLSDIEYEIIKSHTNIGGDIVNDIETIPDVSLGVKYHHERYDGKGYPSNLAGDNIPEVARIIGICDSYDAMNSNRVYRNKLDIEHICGEFEKNRGKQFDPEMTDKFLELIREGGLELIEEKNEDEKKTISEESANLLNQIVKNIEDENKKNNTCDFLTGLLNKKNGELQVAEAIKKSNGCVAFIDLDNLKKTNDILGHLAGDYAIKYVGEILRNHSEECIASRIGGDEFIFFIPEVDETQAKKKIEKVIEDFDTGKEGKTFLSFSSLSIGMCMTSKEDFYIDAIRKADKALYHIKQSGKAGYYMHTHVNSTTEKKESVDLNRLVLNLKETQNYVGNLNLEYRDFTKIYEFVNKMAERFGWDMQLVMITLEQTNHEEIDVEEQEESMRCMQAAINGTLRGVDLSTRFSSDQFLVVLIKAQKKDIDTVVGRIFDKFYKSYHESKINLCYDIADLS